MAHGFRHITNKYYTLNNFLTSRSHVIGVENNSKQLLTNSVQYSTKVNPTLAINEHEQIHATHNRETCRDIITKEKLFNFQTADSNLRFSPQIFNFKSSKCLNSNNKENEASASDKPSAEKLDHVFQTLSKTLPTLFVQPMDYTIYHPDVVFENRIRGIRTVGLYSYVKQVALLRTVGHLKFAYVKFEIIKITQHPEDSTVKVRWTIKGISAMKVMLTFWRYKLWRYSEIFDKCESWYDGFSTFHVNGKGQVVKHVADKMMPDSDTVREPVSTHVVGATKLALIVGIIPKYSFLSPIV